MCQCERSVDVDLTFRILLTYIIDEIYEAVLTCTTLSDLYCSLRRSRVNPIGGKGRAYDFLQLALKGKILTWRDKIKNPIGGRKLESFGEIAEFHLA